MHDYVNSQTSIQEDKDDPKKALLFFCQYAIFNLMPIGLLVYLHHKNFKNKHGESDESDDKSTATQR